MKERALRLQNQTAPNNAVRLVVLLWVIGLTVAAGLVLLYLNRSTPVHLMWGFRGFQFTFVIPSVLVGALIARRRPRNPLGWIILAGGFCSGLAGFSGEYAIYTFLTRPGSLPGGAFVIGLGHWFWIPAYGLLAIEVPLLFPDGRFLTPRWRTLAWLGAAWIILASVWLLLYPGPIENFNFIVNPYGLAALKTWFLWAESPTTIMFVPGLLLMAIAAVSLVYRFRHSGEVVRQQLKWLGYAALLMPLIGVVGYFDGLIPNLLLLIFAIAFPTAIGLAILRYRLYDVDLLINRTLVYGALTAVIVALYVFLVGSAGIVLETHGNLAGLVVTAVLTLIIFKPVRGVVQSGVDRVIVVHRPLSPLTAPTEPTETARLSGRWLQAAQAAWLILAVIAVGILIAAVPGYVAKFGGQLGHVSGNETPPGAHFFAAASGVASLASALLSLGLAALLFRRKFSEPIAAFLSFFLLVYGVVMAGPLEFASSRWWGTPAPAQTAQGILLATPLIALMLLFPSGRFVPGWTRWILLLSIPWNLGLFLLTPFNAASINRNPALSAIVIALFVLFIMSGLYAQIYRYRRVSTAGERQQTRWAILGFALWLVYIVLSSIPYYYLTGLPPDAPTPWWGPASELGWWVSLSFIPICLTIAITRYRLWQVDVVINRTLVYGVLTAVIITLYVLIIGGLGLLFRSSSNLLIPLLATGLAAVLFQPLRQRLQGAVNRMMYGGRDEPAAVLTKLGEQLEKTGSAENALTGIVETVALTLKLPYTAVTLPDETTPIASFGIPNTRLHAFPLTYQGQLAGQMLVAGRPPDGDLTPKDVQLLENIALQAGVVAHNVQLTADLRRSRQKLITTREEERRRLRRDLHDGLGPTLASHMLKIGSAQALLRRDPDTAERLLGELETDLENTLAEVRRLVYNLRPPALDQWGLAGAIRAYAAECESGAISGGGQAVIIKVDAPEPLPPLPAAVEVAAYHIAREGVTNVLRHAGARHCTLRLWVDGGENGRFHLTIHDDGQGLPDTRRAGVGLTAMRERAAELGGLCTIEGEAGRGTRVTAVLPLSD